MQFLIYGAGAVGQALGCMLSASGHDVDLVLRKRYIDTLSRQGLTVEGVFGTFTISSDDIGLYTCVPQAASRYDYALVTTKSYDTPAALNELERSRDKIDNFVSMQNGCGNIEQFLACLPEEKVLGGRIITGFEIIAPGKVQITVSADAIHIGAGISGSIPQSAKALAQVLSSAGHPCKPVENIHTSLYAKLLYNCALNPLGAILGTHYGPLGNSSETRDIINAIINETFEVIIASGGTLPWPNAAAYQTLFYNTLLPTTFNHRPSMLQDLENGKQTEVDSLIGYVSSQGRTLAIATPTCDLLTALIRFRQQQI